MIEKFLDLIWPRNCEVCGRPVDRIGRYLCSECLMRLPFIEMHGLCRQCGRHAVGLDGEYLCEDCRTVHPAYDRAVSIWEFDAEARQLVLSFKFRSALYLKRDFVELLEGAVRARFRVEKIRAVVPMPTTAWRWFFRGYNPAEELAKGLAKRLGVPCVRMLRRCGHPKVQSRLTEEERRKNVQGTFAKARRLRSAAKVTGTVLLVDDIMTTGATLSEAARMLKSMGIETVWAASLARSVRL